MLHERLFIKNKHIRGILIQPGELLTLKASIKWLSVDKELLCKIIWKIMILKLQPHLPGTNELYEMHL